MTLRGHEGGVTSVGFSPDGARVVTASWDEDRSARVWDIATGESLLTLSGHSDGVRSAVFSPGGTRVVTGSNDGTARVWGVEIPAAELQYTLLPIIGFERLSDEQRRRFVSPTSMIGSEWLARIQAARETVAGVHWDFVGLSMQNIPAVLASWREAADRGVPEAHQALSTAILFGHFGLGHNPEEALFHAAVATRIYEALGNEEAAAPMRIRRANLARTLPPEMAAALWPQIRDWRPRVEQ